MVNFVNPPINEVALGQIFDGRPDLLVPYFGEFWASIKDQFPKAQHAAPIVSPEGDPVLDAYGSWLPRVWFVSDDDTRLVQLQQDRLIVNWRQTEKLEKYVRFPIVKDDFNFAWSKLDSFVAEKLETPLQPTRLELSYVNIVVALPGETITDVCQRVLCDQHWASSHNYLSKPRKLQSHLEFFISEEIGALSVRISSAQRRNDGTPVLRFELVVTGGAPSVISQEEWIDKAHDVVISSFRDLTRPEMQSGDWGLQ